MVGLTTVTVQLLSPLVGGLARDDHSGHVVGAVAARILTGILVVRTVSGLSPDPPVCFGEGLRSGFRV